VLAVLLELEVLGLLELDVVIGVVFELLLGAGVDNAAVVKVVVEDDVENDGILVIIGGIEEM